MEDDVVVKKDLIVVESEMAVAVNKIKILSESLTASISEYKQIMTEVSEKGIIDTKIDKEINDIADLAVTYEDAIGNVDAKLQELINDFETSVEDNKDFVYPRGFMDFVKDLFFFLFY